jgi:hypothetical protein
MDGGHTRAGNSWEAAGRVLRSSLVGVSRQLPPEVRLRWQRLMLARSGAVAGSVLVEEGNAQTSVQQVVGGSMLALELFYGLGGEASARAGSASGRRGSTKGRAGSKKGNRNSKGRAKSRGAAGKGGKAKRVWSGTEGGDGGGRPRGDGASSGGGGSGDGGGSADGRGKGDDVDVNIALGGKFTGSLEESAKVQLLETELTRVVNDERVGLTKRYRVVLQEVAPSTADVQDGGPPGGKRKADDGGRGATRKRTQPN